MTVHLTVLALGVAVGVETAAAQIPSPTDVFGFRPGTDYRLADYDQITRYFEGLAAGSDRVVLDTIGRSARGKPLLLAVISSDDNIRNLNRYREISRRLALASDLTDDGARALAREGRTIVWIDGGLHATEVAHGQMTPELAHWLALDEGEEAQRIRANTVALVMPNMNPDGLDIVVEWYRRNVGTAFETSAVPELYHHYIGHDNNRDWYMFTQSETQAVAEQLYHVWFPQIVYNHHQSGPFPGRIWVPPFENPVNPNLDPAVVAGINQIGEAMKRRFALEGKPGVSSGIVYDMWWNGSMRGAPDFHNMLGFLTETALYRYATPRCYGDDEIPEYFSARAGNLPARRPTTQYVAPWEGGCWHLRDPIDYMLTASRAVLDMAARLRDDYLFNIYWIGKRQITRAHAGQGGPFAYVIDVARQHDPSAARTLLRTFRRGGIEIRRASQPFSAGDRRYEAGTYVIPPQAFRPFVVDLLEPKRYPDRRQYPGGPPDPPYDMTGYELNLQMGVEVDRIAEPFQIPPTVVDVIPPGPGGVQGSGDWGVAIPRAHNAGVILVNRLLAMGLEVGRTAGGPGADAVWYVRGGDRNRISELAGELGVPVTARSDGPSDPLEPVRAPRIGLYESYVANMPGGWTRWLLEQYEFQFETLRDATIRDGDLSRFDVVILPSQTPRSIVRGHAPEEMREEFAGGIGEAGAASLDRFVRGGGWLVTVDQSVDYAIERFGLPVRNVSTSLSPSDFFIPGTLINLDVHNDRLTRGMPREAIAMFARSQVLEITDERSVTVLARYATDYLASGWAHGGDRYVAGRVAAARAAVGNGMVVLFGFDPNRRGQPHNTFRLLFNTLYESTVTR